MDSLFSLRRTLYFQRLCKAAGILFALSSTLSAPVFGQLRFQWPETTVDVTRYQTVEECLAAANRMEKTLTYEANRDVDMDTMPTIVLDRIPAHPSSILQFSKSCAQQFDANTFAFTDGWQLLLRLYWEANRPGDLAHLLERRIAAVSSTDTVQRVAVLDTIVRTYLSVRHRPIRVTDSLLAVRMALTSSPQAKKEGILVNVEQWVFAMLSRDTTLATKAAKRIQALNATLKPEDLVGPNFLLLHRWTYTALNYLLYQQALDSLAMSTESFVALRRANWSLASKGYLSTIPVGTSAPTIQGDFFAAEKDTLLIHPIANAPLLTRPQPGRVSLVVFYGHECYGGSKCRKSFTALKRLAQRFPDLDVTVVTETHGYFSYLNPMAPEREAEWLRKWYHDYLGLPGALVVMRTAFWKLPAPDGRRIEEALSHVTDYSFGLKFRGKDWVPLTAAFLVGRDGIILHVDQLSVGMVPPSSEQEFGDLLTVLFRKTTKPVTMPRAGTEAHNVSRPSVRRTGTTK